MSLRGYVDWVGTWPDPLTRILRLELRLLIPESDLIEDDAPSMPPLNELVEIRKAPPRGSKLEQYIAERLRQFVGDDERAAMERMAADDFGRMLLVDFDTWVAKRSKS